MKKIKEIKSKFIIALAQPMADFLIKRLEMSLNNEEEFETWFTMLLYLDIYCTEKGVYLN